MNLDLQKQLDMARNMIKQLTDKWRKKGEFMVRDWVHLRLQPYRKIIVALRWNIKLNPCYFGSNKIIWKLGVITYKLEDWK
jgi:hypothetical protein